MREGFFWADMPTAPYGEEAAFLTAAGGQDVLRYHQSFPQYTQTPLAKLDGLAARLGIKGLYIKDESYRFGLNAFKVLGGSYAMGRWIAGRLGIAPEEMTYDHLTSEEVRGKLGEVTFISATDGNHGRGVAWTAKALGQKSVIYMPSGTARERLENIRKLGADASILDMNYDDCVRLAAQHARERGWVMVQDTAWEGYEEIPRWIMQGYASMALEASGQLEGVTPTHVFLQAGVGSLAGAVAGLLRDVYKKQPPRVFIVEPNKADCLYQTARQNDGRLHAVAGSLDTIMAGLACGEVCTIAWDVLKETAQAVISCPDWVAAHGMRVLGNPEKGDERVISGESGAVTTGLAAAAMQREDLAWLRDALGLDEKSVVLCFSTEGDTDQQNYRDVVWQGKYPSDPKHTGEYNQQKGREV